MIIDDAPEVPKRRTRAASSSKLEDLELALMKQFADYQTSQTAFDLVTEQITHVENRDEEDHVQNSCQIIEERDEDEFVAETSEVFFSFLDSPVDSEDYGNSGRCGAAESYFRARDSAASLIQDYWLSRQTWRSIPDSAYALEVLRTHAHAQAASLIQVCWRRHRSGLPSDSTLSVCALAVQQRAAVRVQTWWRTCRVQPVLEETCGPMPLPIAMQPAPHEVSLAPQASTAIAGPSAPPSPAPPSGPRPPAARPVRTSPMHGALASVASPPANSWDASLRARELVHQALAPAATSAVRMDDEEDREQSSAGAAAHARASSLARGYQALGAAEFHCLDSDAEDDNPTSRVEVPPTPRTRRRLEAALMFSSAELAPAALVREKKRSASVVGSHVANAVASWEARAPSVPAGGCRRPQSAGAVRPDVKQHTFLGASSELAKVKDLQGLLKSEARLAEFGFLAGSGSRHLPRRVVA